MNEGIKKERSQRLLKLDKELKKLFPDAKLALKYKTPFELMVAVQLSAQCTDKKVNEVTEKLFKKYKKLDDYINVAPTEFSKDIFQTGFYRNKTRNILKAARHLKEAYKGKVPMTMKDLITFPGVGRKSANVILFNTSSIREGIVVDTHMIRFSNRFGLTDHKKDAVKIERDLMEVVPKKIWGDFEYRVVEYGRTYGKPIGNKDLHQKDPLIKVYPKAKFPS